MRAAGLLADISTTLFELPPNLFYQSYRPLSHITLTLIQCVLKNQSNAFGKTNKCHAIELEACAFSASECQQSSLHSCHMGFPQKKRVRTASLRGGSGSFLLSSTALHTELCFRIDVDFISSVLLTELSHTERKTDNRPGNRKKGVDCQTFPRFYSHSLYWRWGEDRESQYSDLFYNSWKKELLKFHLLPLCKIFHSPHQII